MTPIRLHTHATPNGHKVSIMLEETGLPYEVHDVDISAGAQHAPAFLALNPNNKIPVIEDPDRGTVVFESGAILPYLAERSGVLVPAEPIKALQWTLFQAAHVGPTLGQLWNYRVFVDEKLPSVIARFEKEAARIYRVLDGQLGRHAHLAGEAYGIADIMTWPWIDAGLHHLAVTLDSTPNLARWHATIAERPAVRRGLRVPATPG